MKKNQGNSHVRTFCRPRSAPLTKARNILAVDTSSRLLSVAIQKRSGEIFELNLEGAPRHSEQLIALVAQGLKELGLKKNELDRLIWGLGPGSFTGLRIGLSILKGLHIGLGLRAIGASSLDLIALGSSLVTGDFFVCVDAKRESVYLAKYRFQNGVPEKIMQDTLVSRAGLIEHLTPGITLAGDALLVCGEMIRKQFGPEIFFASEAFWYPRARFLIQLFESRPKWLSPLSLKTMAPAYFRRSEAEEKLMGRK